MTAGTVHNMVKRTSTALMGQAQAILAALLSCSILNID